MSGIYDAAQSESDLDQFCAADSGGFDRCLEGGLTGVGGVPVPATRHGVYYCMGSESEIETALGI